MIMDANQKPEWKTPELIILTRNKAEEAVLLGCKIGADGNFGPNSNNNACYNTTNFCPSGCGEFTAS